MQLPTLSLANGHPHPTVVPYLESRPATQPVTAWTQSVRTEASWPHCSGRPSTLHSGQPLSSLPQSGPVLLSCPLRPPWWLLRVRDTGPMEDRGKKFEGELSLLSWPLSIGPAFAVILGLGLGLLAPLTVLLAFCLLRKAWRLPNTPKPCCEYHFGLSKAYLLDG